MLGLKTILDNQESDIEIKSRLGKVIENVILDDCDILIFNFTDGTGLEIWDNGQCCCEYRYMATDDDLRDYIGATLLDFELKDAPDIEAGGKVHEVQFLDVKTSKGVFQLSTHNEHNGYYGGFRIVAEAF